MIAELTGSTSQSVLLTPEKVGIVFYFCPPFPKDLFGTPTRDLDVEAEVECVEWTGSENFFQNDSLVDLNALREQSGLTWAQLATLFGVSVRAVHYWVNGENPISKEHEHVVFQLSKILTILDRGAPYRTRKFIEQNLLANRSALNWITERNFSSLEKWARSLPIETGPKPFPVSTAYLKSRLPVSPFAFASEGGEPIHSPKKTRSVKVARKRGKV